MIRARGADKYTCEVACASQAASRGCEREVKSGLRTYTYSMCSPADDPRRSPAVQATPRFSSRSLQQTMLPSVDQPASIAHCREGCGIAPPSRSSSKVIAGQCCTASTPPPSSPVSYHLNAGLSNACESGEPMEDADACEAAAASI